MALPSAIQAVKDPGSILAGLFPSPQYIDDLEIDLMQVIDRSDEYQSNDYAIGKNPPITGSRTKAGVRLSITGILTDAPYDPKAIIGALITTGTYRYTTWQAKRDRLRAIADSNKLVTIVTDTDVYENMDISNLQEHREEKQSGAYFFSISASQKRKVSTVSAEIDSSLLIEEQTSQEQTSQEQIEADPKKEDAATLADKTAVEKGAGNVPTEDSGSFFGKSEVDPLTKLVNGDPNFLAGGL
jgi:hypothetical protein